MNSKIYMLDSNTLTELDSEDLSISNPQHLVIDNFYGETSSEKTISFNIDIKKNHVPSINQPEMMIAINEEIDVTAIGLNDIKLSEIGEDSEIKTYPIKMKELPTGFKELKERND